MIRRTFLKNYCTRGKKATRGVVPTPLVRTFLALYHLQDPFRIESLPPQVHKRRRQTAGRLPSEGDTACKTTSFKDGIGWHTSECPSRLYTINRHDGSVLNIVSWCRAIRPSRRRIVFCFSPSLSPSLSICLSVCPSLSRLLCS